MSAGGNPRSFSDWLDVLDEDVIQGEYGYEAGEFTVYPCHWQPYFDLGLTPTAAFRRALDASDAGRKQREREQADNWARIQIADAMLSARKTGGAA